MMAMMDYPYKTDFMGHLPANPVKVSTRMRVRVVVSDVYLGALSGTHRQWWWQRQGGFCSLSTLTVNLHVLNLSVMVSGVFEIP